MNEKDPRKLAENKRNVDRTRVELEEVNADEEELIIPGEGNRDFDDPVIPDKDTSAPLNDNL